MPPIITDGITFTETERSGAADSQMYIHAAIKYSQSITYATKVALAKMNWSRSSNTVVFLLLKKKSNNHINPPTTVEHANEKRCKNFGPSR
jgi:hypothetical protein